LVLARRYGVTAAAFAVSLLFAGIHAHTPSVVPLFLLSLGLCGSYLWSGSLAAPVILHAAFNGVTVAILFAVR
jgi:membrane protease YdiL (CAAX protease family)